MSFADTVLSHYSGAPNDVRKRLAAVLTEAEKAGLGGKSKAAVAVADVEASEHGAVDAALAKMTVPADRILADLREEIALSEGVTYPEAMTIARRRYPKVTARYFAERGSR